MSQEGLPASPGLPWPPEPQLSDLHSHSSIHSGFPKSTFASKKMTISLPSLPCIRPPFRSPHVSALGGCWLSSSPLALTDAILPAFPQVNNENVVKVGHRQVVNMIRQGGNHLVLKVVTVTRNLDPDDTARKKGTCPTLPSSSLGPYQGWVGVGRTAGGQWALSLADSTLLRAQEQGQDWNLLPEPMTMTWGSQAAGTIRAPPGVPF